MKYRLRQALSALLVFSMVAGGSNVQMLTAYADALESAQGVEASVSDHEGDTGADHASSGSSESSDNAAGSRAESSNDPAGSGTGGGSESTGSSGSSQDSSSHGTSVGSESHGGGSESNSHESGSAGGDQQGSERTEGSASSDTSASSGTESGSEGHNGTDGSSEHSGSGAASSESGSSEGSGSEAGSEGSAAQDPGHTGSGTGSAEDGSETADGSGLDAGTISTDTGTEMNDTTEGSASGSGEEGSSAGGAGGSGETAGSVALDAAETEVLAEDAELQEVQEVDPELEVSAAKLPEREDRLYQNIRAEIVGGDDFDVETYDEEKNTEPEIRVIGRLPEGAYAVAYREDPETVDGLDGERFALESYDITIYDKTDTSYDVLPEEPLMVEIITPEISKAIELDAPLYTWYQSAKDESPEQVIRADRTLDKDTFFSETADGDFIDLEDLIRSSIEAQAAEEEISWEELGYAVYSRDKLKGKTASPSDYEEDDEPGEVTDFSGVVDEASAEIISDIESSLDKIRLSKDAYHFEYTAFGIYSIATDDARLLPLTEQKLEAEVYTGADYSEQSSEEVNITLTGMLPTGGSVRAYPVELDVADGIVLAAYDISIFRADGTLWEPKEENEILVEIDTPALREAMAEDRQFGVLHVTEGTDLSTAEIIPISNALSAEETTDKYALLKAAAEEEYLRSSEASISRRQEAETEELVSTLSVSETLTTESLSDPGLAVRDKKLARTALGAVVSGSLRKMNASPMNAGAAEAETGEISGSIEGTEVSPANRKNTSAPGRIDIKAMYRGHEKMEDLPPSVSDALDQAVFVKEAPIGFYAKTFSVYAIVETILQKTITASDGLTYRITVSYDSRAGFPADAEIRAYEISTDDTDALRGYLQDTADTLGVELSSMTYARLFDISIVDSAGTEYQPDENVSVTIELLEEEAEGVESLRVVHFGEEEGPAELDASTEASAEGAAVTFATDGFSAFSLTDFSLTSHIINAIFGDRKLYENDDIILTGRMPLLGTVEATPVEVTIENEDVLVAYDIKIYANSLMKLLGINWQPSGDAIKVTVKSDVLGDVDDSIRVYHLTDEDSEAELVGQDLTVEDSSVTFDANSFSVYALTPATYHRTYRFFTLNENNQYVEYTLYTDAGTTTFTQIIKNGESLVVPQLPAIPGSTTSTFAGWHVGTGNVDTQPIDPSTIVLDTDEFDFDNIPEITVNGETVNLFARFADFTYVVFHDQYNGSAGGFPVAKTRRGEKVGGIATVQINDFSVAYDDDTDEHAAPSMAFHGWSYTPITNPGSSTDDDGNPVSAITTDTIEITNTVHLYPIFTPIHWLTYHSGPTGSGATYIPSAYYYDGEGPEVLSVPVRSGYSFAGWYTGDNGTGTKIANSDGSLVNGASDASAGVSVSGGRLNLSKNATIYAKWTEAPVNYAVVIWRQRSTDEPNLADANKTYDYAESFVLSATTGTTVSVANTYKGYGGTGEYVGFSYYRCDAGKAVAGDGSTVLNVYYDRNVHTLTFRTWNTVRRTITALYGSSIKDYFPIVGTNGIVYNGYSWTATNTAVYSYALATIETMPNADVTFNGENRGAEKTIYYYVEVDQPDSTRTFNDKYYKLYKTVNHNYNFITYDEEYHPIEGYTRSHTSADPTFSTSNNRADIGYGNVNYLYYNREGYEIAFLDSYTNTYVYVGGVSTDNKLSDISVKYSELIKNHVPADPTPVQIAGSVVNKRDGYSFTGWYTDPACSTRVFFEDNEEYQNYTRSKVLYTTMPAYNLRFYAGWETIWYKVIIDPNYGWLNDGSGTGSTWFWEPYNGDPIEEYTWVKRDYVEAQNGTYFYHYDDRAAHGWGDEWTSDEDLDQQRYAYFTTNQSDATDQSRTFKYAENAYRYAGWYEIDQETGEETLYNFGEPVMHDTYLVLHWKKIGTYHVSYNATITQDGETISGTIDGGDSNETLFIELDDDHYADNAQVVIGRTVKAPVGYNFIGWKIRGDNSGTVYNPGDVFEFQSKYAVTMSQGETIFLDPVYSRISTAKIIYDANGGTISTIPDYGDPIDTTSIVPVKTVDTSAGTATIENLVNNSEIRLSNGQGFSMENAELVGWSESPAYNPETDTLFALGKAPEGSTDIPTYYVDTEEPVTLYAVWQVKVYYHLNESTANANFGGDWDASIYTKEQEDLYSQTIYINNPVSKPTLDPVFYNPDNPENLFFHYWGTVRYAGDDITEYDFSQPVTKELHLYAYWAGPIKVPVHAVDSSVETIADKDDPWLTTQPATFIEVSDTVISLETKEDAAEYAANVPEGYSFAFAAINSKTASLQTISEDKAIKALYYNSSDEKVYVKYRDTSKADEPLADTDEVYLVYYKDPLTLNIGYKVMDTTGTLTDAEMLRTGYPVEGSVGTYSMGETVNRPLYWANKETYKYYSYALGSKNATNSSQLHLITDSSNDDNNRPSLQVRNTWRGYQYSTDDGSTWTSCGYDGDIQLYVIYFETETKPTIVTITEKTIGTAADMEEEFEYVVVITETTTTVTSVQTQWYFEWYNMWIDEGDPTENTTVSGPEEIYNDSSEPLKLKDGESQSVTLFYTSSSSSTTGPEYEQGYGYNRRTYRDITTKTIITTQEISLLQRAKAGFTTSNEGTAGTSTQPYTWTYTTTGTSENPVVTYTNIHTPLNVEVHVALINGDRIILDDNDRVEEGYTISVPINRPEASANTKVFLTEIPASTLFRGDASYGFAGVVYGTSGDEQGNEVTVAGTDVNNITYAQMYPADESRNNIYELTLKNSSSEVLDQLGSYKIYYLYYPLPKVQYVKETAGGTLTRIVENNQHPVNGGSEITLNGVTVTQNQMLNVGTSVFTITQDTAGTATNNYFNMPLILDDTTVNPAALSYLRYSKLGVGDSEKTSIGDLSVTEDKHMMLKIDGNQVKWSFDGSEWNIFDGSPTVYAIYKETGYDLRITKTVTGEAADFTKTFTLTIKSTAITESSYAVTGTGYPTISATPASGITPGSIILTVKHGDDITISGLGRGDYTIEESPGAVLTAKIGEASQTVQNNTVSITLNADTKLDLFNEMKPVTPTGYTSRKRAFGRLLLMSMLLGSMAALPVWYRKRRNGGGDDEM